MSDRRKVLQESIAALNENWQLTSLNTLGDDTDIFGQIDSFAVVELLMETESRLETLLGRYIPLGGEIVLDPEKSPLRSLAAWDRYVEGAIEGGGARG